MANISKPVDRKGVQDHSIEKLQQHLEIVEKQMAEQALLRQKLEQLKNLETSRTQKADEKAYTSHLKLNEENTNSGSNQKNLGQTSNTAIEAIIARRTKEFQKSQAEKAANIQYLAQQRQQIMKARDRLRKKHDMFRSQPSPVGTELVMKPSGTLTHNNRTVQSPVTYIHKLVSDMPDAVGRIWTLRESLYQDYLSKGRPYAGELGIESYEPWQIPDFLMIRHLVEEFVDDFIIKHIPPDYAIFERDRKIKMLNKKDQDWSETSKVLSDGGAVKLVAEEMLLEVTARMTKDIATESIHQDVMFKRMSGNMFMNESMVQATGNPKGVDPSDPVYDLITQLFSTLQTKRDYHKKGVWVHSQTIVQPAVPPPVPLISDPQKFAKPKNAQKPVKKEDKKLDTKTEHVHKEENF